VRAITINANLDPGVSLGVALDEMEALARDVLPEEAAIDYKGQSLDYKRAGESILFVFGFGVLVVFLVLAAQFESWIHPFVIMLCVPATVGGGLLGIALTGNSLNIYTQIGLIMLVGLAAKNGILIVEFANQLRDRGKEFHAALREAALTRFRPILMTSLTAVAGAIPLIFSHGAGSETRSAIGIVILSGVLTALVVTLILVPAAYALLARRTGSPRDVERRLAKEHQRLGGGRGSGRVAGAEGSLRLAQRCLDRRQTSLAEPVDVHGHEEAGEQRAEQVAVDQGQRARSAGDGDRHDAGDPLGITTRHQLDGRLCDVPPVER
jgi:multidrug efflux pump